MGDFRADFDGLTERSKSAQREKISLSLAYLSTCSEKGDFQERNAGDCENLRRKRSNESAGVLPKPRILVKGPQNCVRIEEIAQSSGFQSLKSKGDSSGS